jgi:hypothetical protein
MILLLLVVAYVAGLLSWVHGFNRGYDQAVQETEEEAT